MQVKLIALTKPEIEIDGVPLTPEGLIAYCARVSSPNQENPDYAKLLKYCMKHGHFCYDKETEVLTADGFIPFCDLTKSHLVAAYNAETQHVKFESPLHIYKANYKGDMVRFETFSNDLLVTPNHRMLAVARKQETNKKSYVDKVYAAKDLIDKTFAIRGCVLSNSNERINVPVMDSDLFLSFIGFFIGDGSIKCSGNYPKFHLKLKRKIEYLNNLCEALGICIQANKSDHYVVKIEGFKEFAKTYLHNSKGQKTFPKEFYKMSNGQFSYFLDGLMESDGHQAPRKTETMQYSTTSDDLANALQTLSILNGFTCLNKRRKRKDGAYLRNVLINKKPYNWVEKYRPTKFGQPSIEQYNDKIYCCTVSTGFVIVRRHGKISISGNSVFEQVDMTVEIITTRAIAPQILRHRSFVFQEHSQRYARSTTYESYTARRQDTKNRQNSVDDIDSGTQLWFKKAQEEVWELSFAKYQEALEKQIAKECARSLLPLNTVTRLYMKGSVRSWIHYFAVRCADATQKEHRDIALAIRDEIFAHHFPTIYPLLTTND